MSVKLFTDKSIYKIDWCNGGFTHEVQVIEPHKPKIKNNVGGRYMKIQMYLEDVNSQKHVVGRQLDNNMIEDEDDQLDELIVTFNMLLASSGYNVSLGVSSEDDDGEID